MKLIHTADIHLDASFAASGFPPGFGNGRRQALRRVFAAILGRAQDCSADAVLIAGDLYDHARVSRDTVAFLREQFERIRPIPVFIAPGNRDPYTGASPYASEAWPANVYIFGEPHWTAHELHHAPLTVHGFGFDDETISENPWGTLAVPEDGRVHVAVGHGAERSVHAADRRDVAPFDVADVVPRGLHYLALGHLHACQQLAGDFPTVAYYPGTPEGRSYAEAGPRYFLEVDIDDSGADAPRVTVTPVACAETIYAEHTLDCDGLDSVEALSAAVAALAQGADTPQIARVRLTGALAPALREALPGIQEGAREQFAHLELVDASAPSEDFEDLAAENTSLGLFVKRLNQELRDAPDEAKRAMLMRARDIGVAAYRGRTMPIDGIAGERP